MSARNPAERRDDGSRGDVSPDDLMRVEDGVVRPPGSSDPNPIGQVPNPDGSADPLHDEAGPPAPPGGAATR